MWKLELIHTRDNWKSASKSFESSFKITDGFVVKHIFISSWESVMVDNLSEEESAKLEEIVDAAKELDSMPIVPSIPESKITSFAEFQTANIQRLSTAIEGKSGEEALQYLEQLQERFSLEIWERKEKSWAAEVLKNRIKKTVEIEKGKILPDYEPAKLSGASKSKAKRIKTGSEQTTDKTVALMMKMGISEAVAQEVIKKSMADTFKMASSKLPEVEAKTLPPKCPKCAAFIMIGDTCLICKTKVLSCESCDAKVSSLTEVKTRNGIMRICSKCQASPDNQST